MPATIIDGNALAKQYRDDIARRVAALAARGKAVRLDALLVSSGDTASRVYAENQGKTCAALGIRYELHEFPPTTGEADLAGAIRALNDRPEVTAIMLHLPVPEGIAPYRLQRLIAPEKDVEGVNPANIGNIVYGQSSLVPCTALAVLKMVRHARADLRGRRAVVVGASDVVGKPLAVLLMREEATVISCNKLTQGISDLARSADILIAAAGVPGLVTPDMVAPGAVVIDVGVNRVPDPATPGKMRTVGDVDFANVREIAGWISPVPGGVGPMTVAMLLENVAQAAERAAGIGPG
ncbi:MAG: bifunctional 5,10-methylenetetrahydrofolate dehydrogenase/5,10-methenyltetrahydrofolate cyclohydrolase [Phycisphaerales bacterium]